MDDVICSLENVTPERMTRILQRITPDAFVESVKITLAKRLANSTVARLELATRTERGHSLTRELFLKMIPHEGVDPAVADPAAEIEFYRRLAPSMPTPPIVPCWDAATSSSSHCSHILLADLFDTHSQPRENEAPSKLNSLHAVEALARCHASWWNDERLGASIGHVMSDADLTTFIACLERNVGRFIDAFGNELTQDQQSAVGLMLLNADKIWGRLTNATGLTITHGDCHWWNFLFPNDPENHETYVIDWHLWHIDLAARDLAFLFALGGFAEPRPELEDEFLGRYHDALIESGRSNYGFETLIQDYRWSAIRNLNIAAIFFSQGKHESTVWTTFRRAYDSFERLDCRELIA